MYQRFRYQRFCRALAICALLWTAATRAEVVPDLYAASVPVAEQSAAELRRGAASALRDVLVRVSGRSDAARNPALANALSGADRYLDQYRYERNPSTEAGAAPWLLRCNFSSAQVEQLLRGVGLPVWGANRPGVLVWLVADDGKTRGFVDDNNKIFAAALREQAQRRGLIVHFPNNFSAVSVDAVARGEFAQVQTASAPYRIDTVLIGRSAQLPGGRWSGAWTLLAGAQPIAQQGEGDNFANYLAQAFDRVADALSAQYASVAVDNANSGVTLRVSGVDNFDDYIAALAYLKHVGAIKAVQLVQVSGDEIVLQVKLVGGVEQLSRQLALDNRVTPLGDGNTGAQLNYRWAAPRG